VFAYTEIETEIEADVAPDTFHRALFVAYGHSGVLEASQP
jgi:hypothetical protein